MRSDEICSVHVCVG